MKKRKRITLIFSVVACLAFTLGLSACETNWSNSSDDTTDPTHTHSFTSYVSDNNATCEKDCTETSVCDFEGCQVTDTRIIPNTKLTPTEGIVYKLLESGDGYEVTGYTGTDTQVYIPAIYENLPVTVIGIKAFSICTSLTKIVIPDSVTTIGEVAFYSCSSLTEIVIPNSVTTIGNSAFRSCRNLTEIVIPDSVTTIGYSAFVGCDRLTEIVIGDNVTTIGEDAFVGCSSLTEIKVAENNTSYQSIDGNLYTKDGTTLLQYAIGKTATSFTISNSVTTIGEYAFSSCRNLTKIVIPNSVTTIGERAFSSCRNLTEIVIPDSVTTIGFYAFFGCDSLTIYCEAESKPGGWNSDWNDYGCPVVWDCNNNDIAEDGYIHTVVEGVRYGIKDGEATVVEQSRSIKTVTILSGITYKGTSYPVTTIGYEAFRDCSSLTKIVIPNSVTTIGDSAFEDCDSLTSIEIPDSVTTIGDYAFSRCSSLTKIVIPDGVTTIGVETFAWCDSLTIYCEAESKPSGWDSDWNATNRPVVWGYTGE